MSLKDTLNNQKAAVETKDKQFYETLPARYYGDYRILGTNCVAISKLGDLYMPEDADQVACLEYQVKQGRVTKKTD